MKYTIIAKVGISVYTEVEAETEEEALEIAKDRQVMQLPHDSSKNRTEEWVTDELDGEPYDFFIED